VKWQIYHEYKSTLKPWLGNIPDKWDLKRIKHTTYVKGRIGWQGLRSDEFIDDGPYLVTGTDFINGKVNWQSCYHISEERYLEDPYIQLQNGDLLVTKDGSIGKLAIVSELPDKSSLNSGIFLTRQITKHCLPEFLYWVLSSAAFTNFIDYTKLGSTISHLYQNVFVEFTFPVPSIEEQHTIITFLNRETERIDTLIYKKQRQIELLQEKRAALISHVVTKGLNPNAKMKDSGIEWLGVIPEHWDACKIKYVADMHSGHTPSRNIPEYWENCTIPWISLADIWQLRDGRQEYISETKEKISELGLKNSSAELLPPRTVIVSRTASVGFSGILSAPMSTTQDFVNWVCGPMLVPEYLLYVFRSMREEFRRLIMGSTHKTIYMPDAASFMTPLPPVNEQQQIFHYINKHKHSLEQLEDLVASSISKLQEYRTALISAAVTGKIDVRKEVV